MLIRFKEGVYLKYIDEEFLGLSKIVFEEFQKDGTVPVVTSACDGSHMKGSLHFEGRGWDWRVWGLRDPGQTADRIRVRAQALSQKYDVIFGDAAHLDHIHTEFDIKKGG